MRIEKIVIKNWRSFDDKGIVLDKLKKNNIFIGANNSGKSNVSKYFLFLKELGDLIKVHSDINKNCEAYQKIEKKLQGSDSWAWLKNKIEAEILCNTNTIRWDKEIPQYKENIILTTSHYYSNQNILSCNVNNIQLLSDKKIYNFKLQRYVDLTNKVDGIYDSFLYWQNFLDSLVFIDPIRHHERSSDNDKSNYYFDGAKILTVLNELKNGDREKWGEYTVNIEKWISEIINEKIKAIDVTDKEYRITVKRGNTERIAILSELGTGVTQLVMMLTHLYLNKEKQLNVFIDEPESNLHPDSVIKLMDIFDKELVNHSFYITTHSSSLIDQLNDNWSIHRMMRRGSESTQVYPCNNIVQQREVLDELGIRASQILQSNMVIWVEGPSDAIYLKKWISDISEGKLIDGKHYSFLFYGGSNLTTHEILKEEGLVDFLYTSRYVAIFCDTDCKSEEEFKNQKFKKRVTDTLTRLDEKNLKHKGEENFLKDYVKIWLTDGRETENYVPEELFLDVLNLNEFKRKETKIEKMKVKLVSNKKVSFSRFDSFDVAFAEMYSLENGDDITDEIKKTISKHYSAKKVPISKKIVELWKDKHYSKTLRSEMEELVEMIKKANGLLK